MFHTHFTTGSSGTVNNGATAVYLDASDKTETKLRNTIELQQQVIDRLKLQIEHLIEELKTQKELESDVGFTQEEMNFILSRVHPDKNPDSKMAHKLTTKLIKRRKDGHR